MPEYSMSLIRGGEKPIALERIYNHLRGISNLRFSGKLGGKKAIAVKYQGSRRDLLMELGVFGELLDIRGGAESGGLPPEVAA